MRRSPPGRAARRTRSTRQPVQPATSNSGCTPGSAVGETTQARARRQPLERARRAAQVGARDPDHGAAARAERRGGRGRPGSTSASRTWTDGHAPMSCPISTGRRSPGSRIGAAARAGRGARTARPRPGPPCRAPPRPRARRGRPRSAAPSRARPRAAARASRRVRATVGQWMRDAGAPSRYGRSPSISSSASEASRRRPITPGSMPRSRPARRPRPRRRRAR